MRVTRFARRDATACAIARYVFPVPAGPMPNTMSCWSIASRYRRWLTLFGTYLLAAGRACRRAAQEVVLQLDVLVLRDELRRGLHVAARELVALAHERGQLLEHALGLRDVRASPSTIRSWPSTGS